VGRCLEEGIAIEAYGPLTRGRRLGDATVTAIAAEVGRTPAQVLIGWSLQKGFIVLPRSSKPSRIAENAAVVDFTLDETQIAALDALDEGLQQDGIQHRSRRLTRSGLGLWGQPGAREALACVTGRVGSGRRCRAS
jgi:diketogulonate reductase-like aldo/keto reductase